MEKLFAKIKKETLNPDEKTKIYSALRNFVAENPVRSIKSPFYESWFIFEQRMVVMPIAIVLVFVLTGGTVFAAKNSLPGDILYPIKMIRETMESFSAPDTKAKAQIEVSHAISRLQEVEQIVNSNRQLDKGAGQEIGNNFGTQVQDVKNNINELKNSDQGKDASAIWSDFKKSVAEHEKTISELSNSTSTKDETKQELDNVVSNIHSQLENKTDEKTSESEKSNEGEVKGAETSKQMEVKQNTEIRRETDTRKTDSKINAEQRSSSGLETEDH